MTRLPVTAVGLVLLLAGIGCIIIAVVEFFISADSFQSPSLFWLFFLGIPLVGLGAAMTGWAQRKGASSRLEKAFADFGALKARMDLHVAAEEARDLLTAAQELSSRAEHENTTTIPIPVAEEALRVDQEFLSAEGIDRIQADLSAVIAEVGPELRAEATTIDSAFTAAATTELMSDNQVKLLERRVQSFAIQVEQGEAIAQAHLTDLRTAVDSLRQHLAAVESP